MSDDNVEKVDEVFGCVQGISCRDYRFPIIVTSYKDGSTRAATPKLGESAREFTAAGNDRQAVLREIVEDVQAYIHARLEAGYEKE